MTRSKKMLVGSLGLVATIILIWAGYTHFYEGGLGQPSYQVLKTIDGVELRQYDPFVIASTQLNKDGQAGLNSGFRVLAGYIFGGNAPGEKIAMTAPVLQQEGAGESIPMTAPVLRSSEGMRMAFVMPAGRSVESLPIPKSSAVALTNVDWGEAAALRFSGSGKQERFEAAEEELRRTLTAAGRQPAGPALYAQYNSPSAFPPMRRNEVIIPLEPK